MAMVKCAWCGNYFNNETGISGMMGFGSSYCSKACKVAKQNSKGGGSSGGGRGSSGGGDGGTTIVNKTSMWAEVAKGPSDAVVAARQAEEQAKREDADFVASLKFGDSADEISENLNLLFVKYSQISEGSFLDVLSPDAKAAKASKTAIMEKIEFGLMKLRKKDSDSADFFQKKLEVLKKPSGLGGLFKKK